MPCCTEGKLNILMFTFAKFTVHCVGDNACSARDYVNNERGYEYRWCDAIQIAKVKLARVWYDGNRLFQVNLYIPGIKIMCVENNEHSEYTVEYTWIGN